MADLPFCDRCGRRLELGARFCDLCGRKITFVEAPLPSYPAAQPQAPSSYEIVLGEATTRPLAAAREMPAVGERTPEAKIERKLPESLLPPQPTQARRVTPARRFHITRRAMALSVTGAVAIVIVALAFLGGLVVLPPLPGTGGQTSSQTVATEATGLALRVEINIEKDPVSPGSTQVIDITVRDRGGDAIPDASVHVEVLYPSGRNLISEGSTDTNGQYSYTWYISAYPENVGKYQVTVSATKAGYPPAQAQATFQSTTTAG